MPRSTRRSGTRFDSLVGDGVEVGPETLGVDRRCPVEQLGNGLGCDESQASKWAELTAVTPMAPVVPRDS